MRSLNGLSPLRLRLQRLKWRYYTSFWGMDIHETVKFSLSAHFDRTHPAGVHVGPYTYVALGATIFAHDLTRGLRAHTRIGSDCFIGARSIILPGVSVGDGCVIGAGAVVTKDVPAGCVAAGNPAQIIATDIAVGHYGRFL